MCSLTQGQPLSPGIQVERKRLTSMKCFAATLPWIHEASCIRRRPVESDDVLIYSRMSKNDVQFESVLSSIIIMPVYLNSENSLFLNPGGSENDLPFSPLLLTPADQMSRGELSQCSSAVIMWTNICGKVLSKKIKRRGRFNTGAKQFCQDLTCKQSLNKKKKNYVGGNGLMLAVCYRASQK